MSDNKEGHASFTRSIAHQGSDSLGERSQKYEMNYAL